MAYTTKKQIEAFLKRDLDNYEETLLPLILAAVDSFLGDELGGSYGEGTPATKYYDGGSRILEIDPCTNITKVAQVNDDETESYVYVLNEDFEARPRNGTVKSWIHKRGRAFPCGVANIAVTATFSLGSTVPSDIAYLATYLAAQLFAGQGEDGKLKSESIEGYSRTFKEYKADDPVVHMTLSKYTSNNIVL